MLMMTTMTKHDLTTDKLTQKIVNDGTDSPKKQKQDDEDEDDDDDEQE